MAAPVVLLREVVPTDLPHFFEHQLDPEALERAAMFSRDADAFERHWQIILAEAETLIRTVVADGSIAGYVTAFTRDDQRQVGYWLGRACWGRGIASEALAQFLLVCTDRPLHAVVAVDNPASVRVLQKCGFVEIARDRSSAGGRGPEVDEIIFELA